MAETKNKATGSPASAPSGSGGINAPAVDASSTVQSTGSGGDLREELDFIQDIPLAVTVELGRTKMVINDLLKLGQGSIIELAKPAGETLEILANQKLIARGEVVSVNDNYGIRVTEIISPLERIKRLQ